MCRAYEFYRWAGIIREVATVFKGSSGIGGWSYFLCIIVCILELSHSVILACAYPPDIEYQRSLYPLIGQGEYAELEVSEARDALESGPAGVSKVCSPSTCTMPLRSRKP